MDSMALILAGGKSSRMGEIGELTPKTLLPVFDRPLLGRHIDFALANGAETVWLSVARQQVEVFERLTARYDDGRVRFFIDDHPAGPIRPICRFLAEHRPGSCLILLADMFFEQPVELLPADTAADVVVGVGWVGDPGLTLQNCQVVLRERQVIKVQDKPSAAEVETDLIWSGLIWLPRPLPLAPEEIQGWQSFAQAGDVLEHLRGRGLRLEPFHHHGAVLNLNTPADLLVASVLEAQRRLGSAEDILARLSPWLGRIPRP